MTNYQHLLELFTPTNYLVELDFDREAMTFRGTTVVTGQPTQATNEIRLHSKDLNIESVMVDNDSATWAVDTDKAEIRISASKEISAECKITISYNAKITKPMNGIYPCFFEHEGAKKLIATQFESHHAHEAFPCIDEPAAKATFDLLLHTPADEMVVANTPILEQTDTGQKLVTRFETTPIMSTYLVAFAFGELTEVRSTSKNGIDVGIIATPNNANQLAFALDAATKVLDFYDDYFGIPFPLKKVDHIALPDFAAGAMENWGLITYRESALLLDEEHSSVFNMQRVAIVIAHELAHQWFGNLVTMDWWTDLWLNEGFASWTEYLAVDDLYPDWHIWTQFIADDMFRGMSLDSLESSHPIEVPIDSPADIRSIFDAISYSKGASVIRLLHGFLGADDFRKGISHYLKKHAYGNAKTADLWAALEEVSNKPVTEFMTDWTSQTGFPLVTVEEKSDHIHIEQRRYLVNPTATRGDETWPIPLASDQLKDNRLFKTAAESRDHEPGALVKLNQGQNGFYTVAYPSSMITKLAAEAAEKRLPAEDRMGLVNDTWMLARSGDQATTNGLDLLEGFSNEDNAAVWDVIATQIGLMKRSLGSDELTELLRPFSKKLAAKQAERVGWEPKDNEPHFDRLLRPTVIGMQAFANDPATLKLIDDSFAAMTNPQDIPADLRGVVFSSVARRGGADTYEQLLKAYRSTQSAQIKGSIIAGLTSFDQPELIQKSLDFVLTDEVKLQEIHNWVGGMFANRHSKAMTWDWMKANWQWFVDNFGRDIMTFSYLPKYAALGMNTEEELKDFVAFFKQADIEGIERAVEQATETIVWQSAWRKRDYDSVVEYLRTES